MNSTAAFDFLRRELTSTPGRGSATLRLVVACLVATIPILTHHISYALVIMIILYRIAQEDTAATLMGSIVGALGFTIGLGSVLLAWEISLDLPWLRICFLIGFIFAALFLKRALRIGALGTAIGVPAAIVMIYPDRFPPSPELLTEALLWIWWCVILGLAINAVVHLLLTRGVPFTLLRRALDTRLLAVEYALRRMAGNTEMEPPPASLNALSIGGMTRPLSLLKSASIFQPWVHERREGLAAIVTLTDRLVTAAVALEALAPLAAEQLSHERLLRVADGCQRTRQAFNELRLPSPSEWTALAAGETPATLSPLTEIERTLDQIALAVPGGLDRLGQSNAVSAKKPGLFLPDAFTNPEYVHFAVKGTLAAMICYLLFTGFDYPEISTALTTCLVVSLSTVGASNQKGTLRFGAAIVGGFISMIALVYLFPNVETIGGFWLIFGAGTALAAWLDFGSPRISYAGYQIGLIFYIAVLHFGPSLNLTVVRDRMIGVIFGLIVFSIVEHLLWPVRAADALRARVAQLMHLLAQLARTEADSETQTMTSQDSGSWRRQISLKVEEIQVLIESSKFEKNTLKLSEIQRHTGDAQIVFILLLALARRRHDVAQPDVVREAAGELDNAMATALLALETHVISGTRPALPNLEGMVDAFERSVTVGSKASGDTASVAYLAEQLAVYRALVAAIKRLAAAMKFDDQWVSKHLTVNVQNSNYQRA